MFFTALRKMGSDAVNVKRLHMETSLVALALLMQPLVATSALAEDPATLPRPTGWAQESSDLKADPAVRFGTLPNGLRYAILHNETPSDGVAMRLWIGSGAMMERDEEQGLAHFLEHMAFRGSTNIADGDLVRILERHGLQFGPDTNAFTSQDQIGFQLNFPKANAAALNDGFTILRDVASRLDIKQALVEAERGVVISEERIRDTPQDRMGKAMLRQALEGTRASVRFPIGTVEVLKSAGADRIRRLYQANFRPDNAAVVIVGNIDPAAMEQEIRTRFADWKANGAADVLTPGMPAPRKMVTELVNDGAPDILFLNWVAPVDRAADSVGFEQTRLKELLGLTVLNNRLADVAAKPGSPLLGASAGTANKLYGVVDFVQLNVTAPPEKWREALDAVTQEQRQLLRDGITAAELSRAVAMLRTQFQAAAAGATTRKSPELADAIISNLNRNEVFTSPAQDLALVVPVLDKATPEEVSLAFRKVFSGNGPLLFRSAKAGAVGEAVLAQALADSYARPLGTRVAQSAVVWPYADFGKPGRITTRRADTALGTTTVTFVNGTRLIVKPTQFEKDKVRVAVALGGGKAAVPAALSHAIWAADVLPFGGTGKLAFSDVQRWVQESGKGINVSLSMSPKFVQLAGVARKQDLDSELQLLTAYARDAAFRPEGDSKAAQAGPMLASQLNGNVSAAFARARSSVLVGDQPRFADLPANADITATKAGDIGSLLRPQLASAADVVVVGDVAVDDAVNMVAATFGSGPKLAPPPTKAPRITMPKGRAEPFVFTHSGRADQAMIGLYWSMPDYFANPRLADSSEVLSKVFQQRLVETVRAKLGITYSPSVEASSARQISSYGYFGAAIETPAANFDAFRSIVLEQLKDLAAKPISADELARAKAPVVQSRKQGLERNEYWTGGLALLMREPRQRQSILSRVADAEAVTAADLQNLVQKQLLGKLPLTVIVKGK